MAEDVEFGKGIIGGYILAEGPVEINPGRPVLTVTVKNTGDRPVQVGSHFHFFEVNRALDFDRNVCIGMRLNIPAGSSVRFEPGTAKEVQLTTFAGLRILHGFNGLCNGSVDSFRTVAKALERGQRYGFRGVKGGSAL
ncbi:MAG: ureA [Firmicutes bacterium]|nr:ureA [Bacillota bacterium]